MAGTFPTLSTGSICKYPVTRKSGWLTRVNQFVDFTEQRWVVRQPLMDVVFEYRNLSRADIATLKTFFETQLGAYDTFEVDFDGIAYQNMVFDQDDFSPVEDREPNRFSISFKMKQTRPNGWFEAPTDISGSVQSYPFVSSNVVTNRFVATQRPWTGGETYYTNKVDLEVGYRYSYYWLQTPLVKYELNYPALNEAEAQTLENFFQSMHGRMYHFNFDDPDAYVAARQTPYSWMTPNPSYKQISNCRFDMDKIEITYAQPGQWATKVYIAQFIPPPSPYDTQGLPT